MFKLKFSFLLIFLSFKISAMEQSFNDLEKFEDDQKIVNQDNQFLSLPPEVLIKIIEYAICETNYKCVRTNWQSLCKACKELNLLANDQQIKKIIDYSRQLFCALDNACERIDFKKVIELIDLGAIIDLQERYGFTSMMSAADVNRIDIVIILLNKGADINKNRSGAANNTTLMLAAIKGRLEIVKLLINKGARINETNSAGETALSFALLYGRTDVVEFLKLNGAK